MELWSLERGYSSRKENVQSGVITKMPLREYGNGNVPTNCKYTL